MSHLLLAPTNDFRLACFISVSYPLLDSPPPSGDVVIRRVGSDAGCAQVDKVVVEIIRSLSVYAVMCKDQRSEMRVTSDVCTSATSNQLKKSKLVYVARAREIHSCTGLPTDTLAVEVSWLTLDASAPSSRIEGEEDGCSRVRKTRILLLQHSILSIMRMPCTVLETFWKLP